MEIVLELLLENRNENLGMDVMKFAGKAVINGAPVSAVPYLDNNTSNNPIYGIDWSCFYWGVKAGREMIRHAVKGGADQHTVREVHFDNWGQFFCTDRRRQMVGYVA